MNRKPNEYLINLKSGDALLQLKMYMLLKRILVTWALLIIITIVTKRTTISVRTEIRTHDLELKTFECLSCASGTGLSVVGIEI